MQFGILLLLAAFPILELALLIKLGQWLGFWGTLLLIVGTGVAGILVIRAQGLAMIARLRELLTGDRTSPDIDFEGALLLFAGLLLVLPGPITDICGLVLVLPMVRNAIGRSLRRHVTIFTSRSPEASSTRDETSAPGPIIEGEFERLDERSVDQKRDGRN